MEVIKEYLRSHWGVVKEPLTYVMRKTIIVHTYGDYSLYATHDDEMIARMLHLPTNKNTIYNKQSVQ